MEILIILIAVIFFIAGMMWERRNSAAAQNEVRALCCTLEVMAEELRLCETELTKMKGTDKCTS